MLSTLQEAPAREGEGVDIIAMVVAMHHTPGAEEEDATSPFQILLWDGTGLEGPDDPRLYHALSSSGRALYA